MSEHLSIIERLMRSGIPWIALLGVLLGATLEFIHRSREYPPTPLLGRLLDFFSSIFVGLCAYSFSVGFDLPPYAAAAIASYFAHIGARRTYKLVSGVLLNAANRR